MAQPHLGTVSNYDMKKRGKAMLGFINNNFWYWLYFIMEIWTDEDQTFLKSEHILIQE